MSEISPGADASFSTLPSTIIHEGGETVWSWLGAKSGQLSSSKYVSSSGAVTELLGGRFCLFTVFNFLSCFRSRRRKVTNLTILTQTVYFVYRGVLDGLRRAANHRWPRYPRHSESKKIFPAYDLAKEKCGGIELHLLCLSRSSLSFYRTGMRIQYLISRWMFHLSFFLKTIPTSSCLRLFHWFVQRVWIRFFQHFLDKSVFRDQRLFHRSSLLGVGEESQHAVSIMDASLSVPQYACTWPIGVWKPSIDSAFKWASHCTCAQWSDFVQSASE